MSAWSGKRVLIIGAARQGTALARHLVEKGVRVVLNDQRSVDQLAPARQALADLQGTGSLGWATGGHPLELLDGVDLVCPSGGVSLDIPLVVEATRRGIPLSNDSQIFLEACPCPSVGITGSAGKTTTTTLVGRMAECEFRDKAGKPMGMDAASPIPSSFPRKVWVGGNIGSPLIAVLEEIKAVDLVVMELSSFQLEVMTRSPHVAAVLNITPNHLDRHLTMDAYTAAKARILRFQGPQDKAVLGRDDPGAWGLIDIAGGRVLSFGMQQPPEGQTGVFVDGETVCLWDRGVKTSVMPRSSCHLRGMHNLQNVLAACAIGEAAGLSVGSMRYAVEGFLGVAHRLELVRSWGGADWYNDSIATAPERAMAAIHSFDEPIVLLAGGRDKNLPWEAFADLVRQRVDHLVLFGEAVDKISQAMGTIKPGSRPYTMLRCTGLRQAVQAAAQVVEPGDVVLLSPGGTSFDEFRDFEERGEVYRRWVLEL